MTSAFLAIIGTMRCPIIGTTRDRYYRSDVENKCSAGTTTAGGLPIAPLSGEILTGTIALDQAIAKCRSADAAVGVTMHVHISGGRCMVSDSMYSSRAMAKTVSTQWIR